MPYLRLAGTMADVLHLATRAIHTQHNILRALEPQHLLQEGNGNMDLKEGYALLDSLKEQKSKLEGTFAPYNPFPLNEELLSKFHWDVRAHTPSSLSGEFKSRLVDWINQCFAPFWKKPIFSCLLTCPFFASIHSEISSQSSRNVLFIVYVGLDEHFFTLLSQSEREQHEVLDREFVIAVEVRHFCNQIRQGNVRFLEALFSPLESAVLSSPEFDQLRGKLQQSELITVNFARKCLGQSYGTVAKFRKDIKRFVLREDATIDKLSDSYRLLFHALCVSEGLPLMVWRDFEKNPVTAGDLPQLEGILQRLTDSHRAEISRETILTHLLELKDNLEPNVSKLPSQVPPPLLTLLGDWLAELRRQDTLLSPPLSPAPARLQFLSQVAEQVGGGMERLDGSQILMLTRCGSFSYGLNLPSSDIDYLVVYTFPTQQYLSFLSAPKESIEHRGKEVEVEFCAYELRLFIEQLLKGSIPIFELLLNDELDYAAPFWEELRANRHKLVTEKLITQFFGFIRTHLKPIENGKYADDPKKERKLFYQAFHKLGLLSKLMCGEIPPLRPSGEEKEFIMRIRKGPLAGDLDKRRLLEIANSKYEKLSEDLTARDSRFPEIGDRKFLLQWSLKVRGIQRLA